MKKPFSITSYDQHLNHIVINSNFYDEDKTPILNECVCLHVRLWTGTYRFRKFQSRLFKTCDLILKGGTFPRFQFLNHFFTYKHESIIKNNNTAPERNKIFFDKFANSIVIRSNSTSYLPPFTTSHINDVTGSRPADR